jgi:hypothetical protein
MVLTEIIKKALWLKGLVGNLDLSYELIVIHYDS